MSYVVMVDDNFHHQDPEERYCLGEFAEAEVAFDHCRRIVDEYLGSTYETGMSAADLFDSYMFFGEDPFVAPSAENSELPPSPFSAWDYARERSALLCGMTDQTA